MITPLASFPIDYTDNPQGIACQQKGYILRGKITDPSGTAKLSFELEVKIARIDINTFTILSVSRSVVFPTSTWWGSGGRGSREMPGAIRRWEEGRIS